MRSLRTILLGMSAVTAIAGTAFAEGGQSTDGMQGQTIMNYGTGARAHTDADPAADSNADMNINDNARIPSFGTLDSNSNNEISRTEFTRGGTLNARLFDRLDVNKNAMLSAAELNAYETAGGNAGQ